MATLLGRLADAAARRRRLVIAGWLALLVAGGWFALHQSDRLSGGGWDVPGSQSVRVADELEAFPSFHSPALSILVTGRSPAAVADRLAAVRTTTARDPTLRPEQPRLYDGGRAALAPVALGVAAVFLTGAVIYGLSHAFEMSIYVTNMASMIGIGVAVDYSLFVVIRFRRELQAGATRDEALRRALASSGTAVVFSGAAGAGSLAGLFVIDVNAVRSMAIGAIVVVTISVLATVTLLPALLGPGVERFRIRLPWRTGESGDPAFWRRWTESVMAHPVRSLALVVPFLLLVASPLLAIRTYNRGLEQLPRGSEVRLATEQAQRFAGPGFSGPVHVLVDGRAQA